MLEIATAATETADGASKTAGAVADSQSSNTRPASSHEVATGILEPCDVKLVVKQSATVQDYNIDISALQLRLSPDVMQLLLHLQQVRCVHMDLIFLISCYIL